MRMIVAAKGDQLTSPLDEKFHTDGYRWKFHHQNVGKPTPNGARGGLRRFD